MKKLTTFFVIASILALSLTGCGKASSQASKSTSAKKQPAEIQKIIDSGKLKVGVKIDVPKFGYKNPKTGKIEGFEIDLAKDMAKKILGDPNKIDFEAVTAKTRGPLLDSGEVDMDISTFTITDERKKSYNFSTPYYTDAVGLLVKKSSNIKSFKDLNGKKIGVAQSSTSKQALQDEASKENINVSFLEFASYPEIKAALTSGRVDCFSVDRSILYGYLDDNTRLLKDKFSPQDYGIAIKKSNTELTKLVNSTITDMKKSGQMDKLIQKWGLK